MMEVGSFRWPGILVAFVICPGAVDTDMCMFFSNTPDLVGSRLNSAIIYPLLVLTAKENIDALVNMPGMTVDESVKGMLQIVVQATRDTHGGVFTNQLGESVPW